MTTHTSRGKALITGASPGIGAVYADRLAKRGYDLILVARDVSRLNALSERLTKETGQKIEVIGADLTQKQDLLKVESVLKTDSAVTLLQGLAAALAAAGTDPAKLAQLHTDITTKTSALAAAVAANTPPATPPPTT